MPRFDGADFFEKYILKEKNCCVNDSADSDYSLSSEKSPFHVESLNSNEVADYIKIYDEEDFENIYNDGLEENIEDFDKIYSEEQDTNVNTQIAEPPPPYHRYPGSMVNNFQSKVVIPLQSSIQSNNYTPFVDSKNKRVARKDIYQIPNYNNKYPTRSALNANANMSDFATASTVMKESANDKSTLAVKPANKMVVVGVTSCAYETQLNNGMIENKECYPRSPSPLKSLADYLSSPSSTILQPAQSILVPEGIYQSSQSTPICDLGITSLLHATDIHPTQPISVVGSSLKNDKVDNTDNYCEDSSILESQQINVLVQCAENSSTPEQMSRECESRSPASSLCNLQLLQSECSPKRNCIQISQSEPTSNDALLVVSTTSLSASSAIKPHETQPIIQNTIPTKEDIHSQNDNNQRGSIMQETLPNPAMIDEKEPCNKNSTCISSTYVKQSNDITLETGDSAKPTKLMSSCDKVIPEGFKELTGTNLLIREKPPPSCGEIIPTGFRKLSNILIRRESKVEIKSAKSLPSEIIQVSESKKPKEEELTAEPVSPTIFDRSSALSQNSTLVSPEVDQRSETQTPEIGVSTGPTHAHGHQQSLELTVINESVKSGRWSFSQQGQGDKLQRNELPEHDIMQLPILVVSSDTNNVPSFEHTIPKEDEKSPISNNNFKMVIYDNLVDETVAKEAIIEESVLEQAAIEESVPEEIVIEEQIDLNHWDLNGLLHKDESVSAFYQTGTLVPEKHVPVCSRNSTMKSIEIQTSPSLLEDYKSNPTTTREVVHQIESRNIKEQQNNDEIRGNVPQNLGHSQNASHPQNVDNVTPEVHNQETVQSSSQGSLPSPYLKKQKNCTTSFPAYTETMLNESPSRIPKPTISAWNPGPPYRETSHALNSTTVPLPAYKPLPRLGFKLKNSRINKTNSGLSDCVKKFMKLRKGSQMLLPSSPVPTANIVITENKNETHFTETQHIECEIDEMTTKFVNRIYEYCYPYVNKLVLKNIFKDSNNFIQVDKDNLEFLLQENIKSNDKDVCEILTFLIPLKCAMKTSIQFNTEAGLAYLKSLNCNDERFRLCVRDLSNIHSEIILSGHKTSKMMKLSSIISKEVGKCLVILSDAQHFKSQIIDTLSKISSIDVAPTISFEGHKCYAYNANDITADFPWSDFSVVIEYNNATVPSLASTTLAPLKIKHIVLNTILPTTSFSTSTFSDFKILTYSTLNYKILQRLETIHNFTVFQRCSEEKYEKETIIIDEKTCIVIIDNLNDIMVVKVLSKLFIEISLKYRILHIIFDVSTSHSPELYSLIFASTAHFKADVLNISMYYCLNVDEICSRIMKIAIVAKENISSSWSSTAVWLQRNWLTEEESNHEKLLTSLPCINSYTAQIMLTTHPLGELMSLTLQECLDNLSVLPAKMIHRFYKAIHTNCAPVHVDLNKSVQFDDNLTIQNYTPPTTDISPPYQRTSLPVNTTFDLGGAINETYQTPSKLSSLKSLKLIKTPMKPHSIVKPMFSRDVIPEKMAKRKVVDANKHSFSFSKRRKVLVDKGDLNDEGQTKLYIGS